MYICTQVLISIVTFMCISVLISIRMFVFKYLSIHINIGIQIYIYMYICMYFYVYINVYIHIYRYICIHTCIYIYKKELGLQSDGSRRSCGPRGSRTIADSPWRRGRLDGQTLSQCRCVGSTAASKHLTGSIRA